MAAAQQLTRAGHTVAVFERAEEPGGLLRFGIPEFKMEKAVLDRRIRQMKDEGTNFRCSVEVGKSVTGAQLKQRYDAVVLATGSTIPRDLPVPGRELGGILQAMEFLPQANRVARGVPVENQVTAEGKNVVIIGGGDTGADCLGTSIRQGAKSVTQLEILPTPPEERPAHQPWPTYPMTYRVSSAHEEAGERVYSVSTSEFVGDENGQVAKLRLVGGGLRERQAGRRSRAPSRSWTPSWCCWPWGSSGRSGTPSSVSSGSSSTSGATSSATTTTPAPSTVSSSAATPVGVSR